ncbi:thiamine phosphate synthase [Cytobacillus sp. Hm23]
MSNKKVQEMLPLYFVMGSQDCLGDPCVVLLEAIRGGITAFQYREKGVGAKSGIAKYDLGIELQKICKDHNIPFFVNDDIELAIKLQADGVHIGQEDEPVENVRSKIGSTMVLGVSAHTVEQAKDATAKGADYLGVGSIYPTNTKEDATNVNGPSIIQEMRDNDISVPIVAIGGIKAGKIQPIIQAGAEGVAVITAITHAEDKMSATRKLIEEVSSAMN